MVAVSGAYTYLFVYPPPNSLLGAENPTCCQQLLACKDIEPEGYDYFVCYGLHDVRGGVQFRNTCERQLEWVMRQRGEALEDQEAAGG